MQSSLKKGAFYLVNALVGLYFVINLPTRFGEYVGVLLVMLGGLALLYGYRKKSYPLRKLEKTLFLAFFYYFFTFVVAVFYHHDPLRSLSWASRPLFFMALLPLFYFLPIKLKPFSFALILGAFSAVLFAIYERYFLYKQVAFSHHWHIQGGDMAMSLAFFAFILGAYFYAQGEKKWAWGGSRLRDGNFCQHPFHCSWGIIGSGGVAFCGNFPLPKFRL